MGCNVIKSARRKDTKRTLRQDDSAFKFNEETIEDVYKGLTAKDVLEVLHEEDLLLAVKNGSSHVVEALCVKFALVNVSELRGIDGDIDLLRRDKYSISNWNLLLIAIAYGHLFAVKMFTKTLKCHLRVALRAPAIVAFSRMSEEQNVHNEVFPLLLAINNRSEEMLRFLWTELKLLWDSFHLLYLLQQLSTCRFLDGLHIVLSSQTAHEIYLAMPTNVKMHFLESLLFHSRQLDVKETLKFELTLHPYATLALFLLLDDQKGFNAS